MKDYRKLNQKEIVALKEQNNYAENWDTLYVKDNFTTERIHNVRFSGNVCLGHFDSGVTLFGGIKCETGIYNAVIHNCKIGDNVYINHTKNYICNYDIGDNTIIENIDIIAANGESTYGNAIPVSVLNEGGGREILMYDNLSSQTAYILALYRHKPKMIARLNHMIQQYAESVRSSQGTIGKNCRLSNCSIIKNVRIGDNATIEGSYKLEEGSINSNEHAPVYIGAQVIADHFIFSSGCKVTDGALVKHSFIGQATEIGSQYSVENSAFFSNCGCFHGEACSIFAGPYTVTHHKSTLLIAGLFSFMNAGSGSNQSNHMYKLGPVHQGVAERGCKTSSDSYILWPAKIGAFTIIMGRHYKNSDTSDFPFSYLIENKDESILVPGYNLRSVGTIRDVQKWPKRDKRTDPNKLDFINFNLLSPYTIQKTINGREILKKLNKISGADTEVYTYNNVKIENRALKRGIDLYQIVIDKFIGNSIISRLNNKNIKNVEDLRSFLKPLTDVGKGYWVDVSGLIAPKGEISRLKQGIEDGEIKTCDEINAFLETLHKNYYEYEWTWVADIIENEYGKALSDFDFNDVINIINQWKKSVVRLDKMLYHDAEKEFTRIKQTGFGIDGGSNTTKMDFDQVRGEFESNSVVMQIKEHIEEKSNLGDNFIKQIETIKNTIMSCAE